MAADCIELDYSDLWTSLAIPERLRPAVFSVAPATLADWLPPAPCTNWSWWGWSSASACSEFPGGTILLSSTLPARERRATLLHEAAHNLLHRSGGDGRYHTPAFLALVALLQHHCGHSPAERREESAHTLSQNWQAGAPRWLRRAAARDASRIYCELAGQLDSYRGNAIDLAADCSRRQRWWWRLVEPIADPRPPTRREILRCAGRTVAWLAPPIAIGAGLLTGQPLAALAGAMAGAVALIVDGCATEPRTAPPPNQST